jgi:hypothetical protein
MELKMKEICAGTKQKNDVVHECLEQYRDVFVRTMSQMDVLKAVCSPYPALEPCTGGLTSGSRHAGDTFSTARHDCAQRAS